MATDLISIFIGLFFMTIGIWILNYIIVIEFELHENFLAMLISLIFFAVSPALAFFAGRSIYSPSNSDEKNCYEITVNEKSFKTTKITEIQIIEKRKRKLFGSWDMTSVPKYEEEIKERIEFSKGENK